MQEPTDLKAWASGEKVEKEQLKTDPRIFFWRPNSFTAQTHVSPRTPAPPSPLSLHEQYGWSLAARLRHSGLLFSYSIPFPGGTRDIFRENSELAEVPLWRERYLAAGEATVSFAPHPPSLSLTGLMAANGQTLREEHTNKKKKKEVNGGSLEGVRQQNSSIQNFLDSIKKKDNCNMKRKLKKVCEMSEYLTLIPLLREMCFPCYHSCLEKKNDNESGKLKFLCLFSFSFSFFFFK